MNLSDPNTVHRILSEAGFSFKKSLGQNFLIDPTVCPRMAEEAASRGETVALEIGPGIGVLTVELAEVFETVIAVELDERLRPVLAKTLAGHDHVEVVWGDALTMDLAALLREKAAGRKVAVCANLPYYITSPLLMHLLESNLPVESLTVMVQKEAAERLTAAIGTREAGAVTVAVQYYAEAERLFDVPRESFLPAPQVDSTVIGLTLRKQPPFACPDETVFFAFVKAAFGQRRKTLVNSLSSLGGYAKENILWALERAELPAAVRAEALSMEQLAALFMELYSERKPL